MTITLSTDQANALDQGADWYTKADPSLIHCNGGRTGLTGCPSKPHTHGTGEAAPVYAIGGWAGTGKTTLMQALEDALGVRAVYGVPTHKAAAVLRQKLIGDQSHRVRTLHSLIYHMHATHFCDITGRKVRRIIDSCTCQQDDACQCPARFDPCGGAPAHQLCHIREELEPQRREFLGGHRSLVVIDESSMLSPEQVTDIRSFGVPVILVGDHGQLPPVKAEMNHYTRNPDVELTRIHRQGADSGVLQAAHDVRRGGRMSRMRYGNDDAVRYALSNPVMEGVFDRWTPGPERILICHTNQLRAQINAKWHGTGPLRVGDRVVALGGRTYEVPRAYPQDADFRVTAEFLTVHNGMTGTVLKVMDTQGGPVLDMIIQLDDHVLATPDHPVCLLVGAVCRAQFGAERDLWKNSPDRPRGSRLWDYAYALTAYKAQGSEFDQVVVMDEHPPSYAQWLYTSITRAKKAVITVDCSR